FNHSCGPIALLFFENRNLDRFPNTPGRVLDCVRQHPIEAEGPHLNVWGLASPQDAANECQKRISQNLSRSHCHEVQLILVYSRLKVERAEFYQLRRAI